MLQNRNLRRAVNLLVVAGVILTMTISATAQGRGADLKLDSATGITLDSTYSINTEGKMPLTRASNGLVSIIVQLDGASLAAQQAGGAQLDAQAPASVDYMATLSARQETFKTELTKSVPDAKVTHQYKAVINGLSMILPANQVAAVAALPGVKAIYRDELRQPQTDNSPKFIGAPAVWKTLGGQEKAGEGVLVGMLDTGIWPEHPSFSDPDPSGKHYTSPSGGPYPCNFGNTTWNPKDVPFTCNNKLVGAYEFLDTYKAVIGLTPKEFDSARDDNGHGTHTSSTAAGNANVAASIFGVNRGIVSGIAPRAHVIMYRVCAAAGCFTSDSAAAVEQTVLDGVNVINFSISGGANPYADAVSLAFLDAYNAGVFVAASAGNAGPSPDTTDHREPWVTTVAASTQDRAFESTVTVTADNGNSMTVTGATITAGILTPTSVVLPPTGQELCPTPFPAGTFHGEIVVCRRGGNGRADKGYNVFLGGAGGMILYNQPGVTDLETDNHFLPAVQIENADGTALLAFLSSHTGVKATFPAGVKVSAQGDVMASFSSRGGPGQSLGVSKPDITAPGVQVLAGMTPDPNTDDTALGPPGQLFQAIAGTSMSSPHIAGAGALIKALHPDWTPGQIKSALMTTAKTDGVVEPDGVTPATTFDDGSGRVDLSAVSNAIVTFNETGANYVALKNHLWDANYPSLYVPVMPGQITVQRTLHNTTNHPTTWNVRVSSPSDVSVRTPEEVQVPANGDATFSITVIAPTVPLGEVRSAMLTFQLDSREKFHVDSRAKFHFPITFVRMQPAVTLDKTCDPLSFKLGAHTDCTITAANLSFSDANVTIVDRMPLQLRLLGDTITGATQTFFNSLAFQGKLAAAQPPDVMVTAGTSNNYLSLSSLTPIPGVGDETITNYNVPAFLFGGKTWSRIGIVSDGYAVVGGGTGADVQFLNQNMPEATPPNNVLAPFWTDLNPAFGGAMHIAIASGGGQSWLVLDWDKVVNYSNRAPNSFQIWIGLNGVEDITFAYGAELTNGEGGALSVGAENEFGNRGDSYYYNGAGTLPLPNNVDLIVSSTPIVPGETHVITFSALGKKIGAWTNCAAMTADIFAGTNVACASGKVTAPKTAKLPAGLTVSDVIFLPLMR